jgi:hypothetical protein
MPCEIDQPIEYLWDHVTLPRILIFEIQCRISLLAFLLKTRHFPLHLNFATPTFFHQIPLHPLREHHINLEKIASISSSPSIQITAPARISSNSAAEAMAQQQPDLQAILAALGMLYCVLCFLSFIV